MRVKVFLLLTALFLLTACGSGDRAAAAATDGVLQIVATTSMITDITKVVGGDHVQVTGLMGAGIDPHLYVASEGDMALLQEAEVIFYNGLLLEAQMAEILEQIGERKTVVAVTKDIDPARLLPWAQYADEFDPHVWFDVTLWMSAVETVRDTLIEADAAHADAYRANAESYLAELTTLDVYVKEQAARLPPEQRILITAHDAFHYFGRAYGFDVRGLQGISTASEAGTADVQALADFIAEKEVKALFIETSVPVRNIEALEAAVQARGFEVTIGGQLFSDAMGDPGTPEGSYIGMVRHNIDTIVGALVGE
jgi:manganese/zinc/iron transport system substrate-binding protein